MTTYTNILLQDTANNYFIPYGLIDRLGDVDISNPTTGQNLTYDATSGKWKNTSTSATVAWGGITGNLTDQTDLNTALRNKQDTLVSGTSIKTINNTSLLGSGDISVGTVTSVNNVAPISGDVTLTASDVGALPSSTSIPALYSTTGSNIDGAMTQDATTTSLNGKADKDLSNLTSTSSKNFDGQWENVLQNIISSSTSLNGSTNLNYRIDLPNDGNKYEVMIRANGSTGSTSGNYIPLYIRGNEDTTTRLAFYIITRTASAVVGGATVSIIASYVDNNSTNCVIPRSTNYNGTTGSVQVIAYRRIGTNS